MSNLLKNELVPDGGIPKGVLFLMAAVAGLSVANLYYNQPLLEEMRNSLGVNQFQANLISFITQAGYALGLLLVVPLADRYSRRRIISVNLSLSVLMCLLIAVSDSVWFVWGASLVLGCNSVVPQMFIPVANHFSLPENKSRNMGFVLSGLLSGILGARVVSGYVGEIAGWRIMFVIAACIMVACLVCILCKFPMMQSSFSGSYRDLMKSIGAIYCRHRLIRIYSLRGAFSFGSMMSIWSCMAFHLSEAPFFANSDKVGLLGLCGLAGAFAASGIGKYVVRIGIERFCVWGSLSQVLAWCCAFLLQDYYVGMVLGIILVDVGVQCQQLCNQTGCFKIVPQATNRANTIFMTHLFVGGSLGTLASGCAWNVAGWNGVCIVGMACALISLAVSCVFRPLLTAHDK